MEATLAAGRIPGVGNDLERLFLPIDPLDVMSLEVRVHRFTDRRKEAVFAEARKESEALQEASA
jgi:hypothetical protein